MSEITTKITKLPKVAGRFSTDFIETANKFLNQLPTICVEMNNFATQVNDTHNDINHLRNQTQDYKNAAYGYKTDAEKARNDIKSYVIPTNTTYSQDALDKNFDEMLQSQVAQQFYVSFSSQYPDFVRADIDYTINSVVTYKQSPIIPDATKDNNPLNKGQLLTEIKNIDGAGSGIDADLIRGLPGDFTGDLNSNGYQKLPSGLIIQWGSQSQTTDSNGNATYTLPTAFPNACFSVNCVSDSSDCTNFGVTQLNVSSFTVATKNADGSARGNTSTGCRFIAIGY